MLLFILKFECVYKNYYKKYKRPHLTCLQLKIHIQSIHNTCPTEKLKYATSLNVNDLCYKYLIPIN